MVRESLGELVHQELAPIGKNQRGHFKTYLKALVDERYRRLPAGLCTVFPKLAQAVEVVKHNQPEPLTPQCSVRSLVLEESLQRGPDAERVFRIYAIEIVEDQNDPLLIVFEYF